LARGNTKILNEAVHIFEGALIDIALKHPSGRKKDASDLLGWGRNTLTRKIKELDVL
jgi:two-component system nitrogen regulation response regulator GlnG